MARRHAGARRGRAQSDRPQVPDRLSRRAAPGSTSRCEDRQGRTVFESGRVSETGLIDGNDSDAAADTLRAALRADHQRRSGADLRIDHGHAGRRADHRPAPGDAVPQGQPAAAARLRQADGRGRRSRCSAARPPTRTSRATAIAFATGSRPPEPAVVDVELRYQPIGYRWAQNLAPYKAAGAEEVRQSTTMPSPLPRRW